MERQPDQASDTLPSYHKSHPSNHAGEPGERIIMATSPPSSKLRWFPDSVPLVLYAASGTTRLAAGFEVWRGNRQQEKHFEN